MLELTDPVEKYDNYCKQKIIEELENIRPAIVKEIKDRNGDLDNTDMVVVLSMALAIIQKRLDELKGED